MKKCEQDFMQGLRG